MIIDRHYLDDLGWIQCRNKKNGEQCRGWINCGYNYCPACGEAITWMGIERWENNKMTKEQANTLINTYKIIELLDNKEEVNCLKEADPKLLEAWIALVKWRDAV